MTSIDTYGGLTYNNFGTRNLAFLKISAAGTSFDLTTATGPDTDASNVSSINNQISIFDPAISQTAATKAYLDSNSYFSVAVRTIQQFAEVYMVGTPYYSSNNSGFIVAVAIDTANSAATGTAQNTEVFNTAYPTLYTFAGLAAQIKNALNTSATANSANGPATVGSTVTGVTISQIFPYGTGFVAVGGGASAT
jgi:hypothetical protein